jgi:alpha-D-ribose 1-methylphosphonate 5-phosphate C-P lyase
VTVPDGAVPDGAGDSPEGAYSYAFLDELTKRNIRRAILKAIAIPGYQVPFVTREMPLPLGWGTGGIQVTASLVGPSDVVKVIDQGADDSSNAISIRDFFVTVAGVRTTPHTQDATIIQTRHRIPEEPLQPWQVLVFQVPQPEPMRTLIPREGETRKLHALQDYGVLYVKLYEDVARHGEIATAYDYPVLVNDRYIASPSPIPKFDNPKLDHSQALLLFCAGRERRIYAIPPHTEVKSLAFEDKPFRVQRWKGACQRCGSRDSYLNAVALDHRGGRMLICSDTDYCDSRLESGPPSSP